MSVYDDEREPLIYIREREYPVRHLPEFVATLVSCLASMSLGFTLGFSSPTIPELEALGSLKGSGDVSWFGSLLPLGGAAGAPLAIVLIDKIGRKGSIMLCNLPLVFGYLMMITYPRGVVLYAGRALTGVGMGIATAAVPVYIAEIATKEFRGRLSTLSQAFTSTGVLLVYVLGSALGYVWLCIGGIFIALLTTCAMFVMPETPRWYLSTGYRAGAFKSLYWLRGRDADVIKEASEIQTNIEFHKSTTFMKEISKKKYFYAIFVAIMMQIFSNLVGKNVYEFYAESIVQAAGFTSNPQLPAICMGLAGLIGVLPATLLLDCWGRKTLLYISTSIILLTNFCMGLHHFLDRYHPVAGLQWMALCSLLLYNMAFSLGPGTTGWLVVAEVLPFKIRALGSGIATTTNWLMAFVVTKWFPILVDVTSEIVGFWILAGFSFFFLIFIIFAVQETKGRSLEEIERTIDRRFSDE